MLLPQEILDGLYLHPSTTVIESWLEHGRAGIINLFTKELVSPFSFSDDMTVRIRKPSSSFWELYYDGE